MTTFAPLRVLDFDERSGPTYRRALHDVVEGLVDRSDARGQNIETVLALLADKTVEVKEIQSNVDRLMVQADEQVLFDKKLKEAVDEEVKKAKVELRQEMAMGMPVSGGAPGRRPDFDERKLKIVAYGGDRSLWRDFAGTLSSFIGRESRL